MRRHDNKQLVSQIRRLLKKGNCPIEIASRFDFSVDFITSLMSPGEARIFDETFQPRPTTILTDSRPQTPERIEVYRQRVAAGQEIWCETDPGNHRWEKADLTSGRRGVAESVVVVRGRISE